MTKPHTDNLNQTDLDMRDQGKANVSENKDDTSDRESARSTIDSETDGNSLDQSRNTDRDKYRGLKITNAILALLLGATLAILAIVGSFEKEQLGDLINVDPKVDILRGTLALVLLAAVATYRIRYIDAALFVVGITHVIVGSMAIVDRELNNFAPSNFTDFDIAFYLIAGALATFFALLSISRWSKYKEGEKVTERTDYRYRQEH